MPQRPPVRSDEDRAIIGRQLAKVWELIDGELGESLVGMLRALKKMPSDEQAKAAGFAQERSPSPSPPALDHDTFAQWLLDHALVRGLALPGLRKADLFVAIVEGFAEHEEIAAAMDRSRDWEVAKPVDRHRLDQRKVMKRLSVLNSRRKAAGYRNS